MHGISGEAEYHGKIAITFNIKDLYLEKEKEHSKLGGNRESKNFTEPFRLVPQQ